MWQILMEQRDDVLAEFYESRALIRSDEASLIHGLLVSLNVVDCNLCVKVRGKCVYHTQWMDFLRHL